MLNQTRLRCRYRLMLTIAVCGGLLPTCVFAQDPSHSSLALATLIAEGDGPIEADKQPQLPEVVPASPDATQDSVDGYRLEQLEQMR